MKPITFKHPDANLLGVQKLTNDIEEEINDFQPESDAEIENIIQGMEAIINNLRAQIAYNNTGHGN